MFWESRSILPVLRNNDRMWTFLAFSDIQHATKLTVLTVLLPVRLHLSSFYTCEFVIYVQALKQPFDILPLATRIDSLGLYAMTAVQVRAHAHSAAFVSQTELLKWQCAVIPCSPALCRTWHCVVESDPKFQNDTRHPCHPCHPCHPSEATGLFRILSKTILTALMLTAVKHPMEIL